MNSLKQFISSNENKEQQQLVVEEESAKKLGFKILIGLSTIGSIFDKWIKLVGEDNEYLYLKNFVKESIELRSMLKIKCYREFRNKDKWKIYIIPFTKMESCFNEMILFDNLEENSQKALYSLTKRKGQMSVFYNIEKNSSGNEIYYTNFMHDEYINYQIQEKGLGFLLFMNSLEIMYGIDKLKEFLFVIEKSNCGDVIFNLCKNISEKIQEETNNNKNNNNICLKILLNYNN